MTSSSIIDPTKEDELHNNWYKYALQVVNPIVKLGRQADWAAQLSWSGGQGGKQPIEPSNGGRSTNPPSSKIQTVVSTVLVDAEKDPYNAYQACVYPFVKSNGDFKTSMWLEIPANPNTSTDLDFIAIQEFVRNNLESTSTVEFNLSYIGTENFIELGRIGELTIYALGFNKDQYVTPQGTRVMNGPLPATGSFGYVALERSSILNNTTDARVKGYSFSAVPSGEFHRIAGNTIYLEIIYRFLEAQKIGKSGSFYGAATVMIRSGAFPYIDPISIPVDSLSAWQSSVPTGQQTRLNIVAVDDDPTTIVDLSAIRQRVSSSSGIPTSPNAEEDNAPETAPPVPKAELSGASLAFLIIATLLAIVGIVCMIVLVIRISTAGKVAGRAATLPDVSSFGTGDFAGGMLVY